MSAPERVGVLGGGRMGAGIAHAFLTAGAAVVVVERSEELATAALERVRGAVTQSVARGTLDAADEAAAIDRLRVAASPDAFADADLVVEAVPEELSLKLDALRRIEAVIAPTAWLATNTSSLPITELAASLSEPTRFGGLHFFNPVPASQLVEIVQGPMTSDTFVRAAQGWVQALGKTAITVSDSPGFASSRLGLAIALEAMRMVEEGVGSADDIDTAMVLGYRHPTGPLRTSDLVGLDVRLGIAEHLHATLGPRFEPPAILRRLVADGALGRKTGRGFFDYSTEGGTR
jgi:3-hydroxybutyryl-CoA dehydrogenase